MAFDRYPRMSSPEDIPYARILDQEDQHVSIGPRSCPSGFFLICFFPLVYILPAAFILGFNTCVSYAPRLYYPGLILYCTSCFVFYVNNLVTTSYRYYCTKEMRFFKILNTLNVFAALGNSALFFSLFTKDGELWFAFLGMACYFVSISEYFPAMRQEHSIAYCKNKLNCSETPCGSENWLLRKNNLYIAFTAVYLFSQIVWMSLIMIYIQDLAVDERPDAPCMNLDHLLD